MAAIDVPRLVRLRRTAEAAAASDPKIAGQGLIASSRRIIAELQATLGQGDRRDEFDRLFAGDLESIGKPWGVQAIESQDRLRQIAEWLDELIELIAIELSLGD